MACLQMQAREMATLFSIAIQPRGKCRMRPAHVLINAQKSEPCVSQQVQACAGSLVCSLFAANCTTSAFGKLPEGTKFGVMQNGMTASQAFRDAITPQDQEFIGPELKVLTDALTLNVGFSCRAMQQSI